MIVVDSNIFFSALLSKNSSILDILLSDEHHFIAPNYIFIEIFNHKEKIIKYSKLSEDELLKLMNNILSKIQFLPLDIISLISFKKAISLCEDVDERDTVFVALAIEFNAQFWTGDKRLIGGLVSKGYNQFFYVKSK